MKKPKHVNGLANIGLLVAGATMRNAPKQDERDVKDKIVQKTLSALAARAGGIDHGFDKAVTAAVREAFNAGHANALEQNSMVEELLKKQYSARTELTLPVAAMAIMEQVGLPSILLDLDAVATVSSRCRVELASMEDADDKMHMRFTLRTLADDGAATDNSYMLKA